MFKEQQVVSCLFQVATAREEESSSGFFVLKGLFKTSSMEGFLWSFGFSIFRIHWFSACDFEVRMKALLEQQGLAAALEELPAATIVAYDDVIQ
ncbi:hypothetical protein Tco_0962479 [Tanacetum coccineum]